MKKFASVRIATALGLAGLCSAAPRPARADQRPIIQLGACIDESFHKAAAEQRGGLTAQEQTQCVESTASPERISGWCEWVAGRGSHREYFSTYVRENTASVRYGDAVAAVQAECTKIRVDLENRARQAQLEQKRQELQSRIGQVDQDLRQALAQTGENEATGDVARTRFDQISRWHRSICDQDAWCQQTEGGRASEQQLKELGYPETTKALALYKNAKATAWVTKSFFNPKGDSLNEDWTTLLFAARCHSGFIKDISRDDGRPSDAAVADAAAVLGELQSIDALVQQTNARSHDTAVSVVDAMEKWRVPIPSESLQRATAEAAAAAEKNLTAYSIRKGDTGFEHCQESLHIPDLDAIK